MKFGSMEWFSEVEKLYDFPCTIAFYISNKSNSLMNIIVDSAARNEGDIKYSKLAPDVTLESGEHLAIVSVDRIANVNQYYSKVVELKEIWKR